jgi:hypothetical protein
MVLVIGSIKGSGAKRRPRIRISGFWLESFGFPAGTLVSGEFKEGSIILKAEGTGVKAYSGRVSGIRKSGGCLMQVLNQMHNRKRVPHFEMAALWLEHYGFNIGGAAVLYCSHGLIKIVKLDIPPP